MAKIPLDERSPQESYRLGLALLKRGHSEDAFERLSQAYLAHSGSARIQSAYALALAQARHEHERATQLALAAIREEPYNPDFYLHLAEIHLAKGAKSEAVQALRHALIFDSDHRAARSRLAKLGVRRRPIMRFLPRAHGINRALGRLRAQWRGRKRA